MYQRILVTSDGSALSHKAEQAAIDLAAGLHARLWVLHVVRDYPVSFYEGAVTYSADEVARVEKALAAKAQAAVEKVVTKAAARDVPATAVITRSDRVADAILATAHKHKCDLIVMASHGRSGIGRVLLGSETQHVLSHTDTPVLVLR